MWSWRVQISTDVMLLPRVALLPLHAFVAMEPNAVFWFGA